MTMQRLQAVEEDSHDDQHSGKGSKIMQSYAGNNRKITLNFGSNDETKVVDKT